MTTSSRSRCSLKTKRGRAQVPRANSSCSAQALVRHRARRYRAQLTALQSFDADGSTVEAHELDDKRGTSRVNMDDHTDIASLQPQRGQRAGQHHLIVFLMHLVSRLG